MSQIEEILDSWHFHHDQPDFRSRLKRQYLVRVTFGEDHERDFVRGYCDACDFIFNGANSASRNPPFDSAWLGGDDMTCSGRLFSLITGMEISIETREPVTDFDRGRIVAGDLPSLRKACGRDDLL